MLKNPPVTHDKILSMCNFHLIYLGRRLFIELTKCSWPLEIIDSTEEVKVVAIGGLTFSESESLDKVIFRGLGVGVDWSKGLSQHIKYGLRVTHLISESMIKTEPDTEKSTVDKVVMKDSGKKSELREEKSDDTHRASKDVDTSHDNLQIEDKDGNNKSTPRVPLPVAKPLMVLLEKLKLKKDESVKLTPEKLKMFLRPVKGTSYDSDDTIDY